jgi:3-dehydroquinate dehydratase / shikimate dehydrogenase
VNRPEIAVAIGGPTNEDALRAYDAIAGRAGVVELRVDLFSESAKLQQLIAERPCPVVVTCRASIEGGSFSGSEAQRLDILREAAALGADLIDVERFAFADIGDVSPTRVIVSQHDFNTMPADLLERAQGIHASGADVVKVAGMASDVADILPVVDVLQSASVPTIAMAMGTAGVASRIIALRYPRCVLTYASLDGGDGTAPGQISLGDMHSIYHAKSIDASTRFFGLVAPSLDLSLIETYNTLLARHQINAVCIPLPTSDPSIEFLRALIPHGFAGFHVHGPGQESLRRHLTATDDINSLSVVNGQLLGGQVSSPGDQVEHWLAQVA